MLVCIGNAVWSRKVLDLVRRDWGMIMNMDSHPYSWWNLRCHFMILLLTGCRGYDFTLPKNRRIGYNKTEKHFSLQGSAQYFREIFQFRITKSASGQIKYRISSYSFRGNYSFLNLEIQRSQYIQPKVTVHKCAETIQGRKLFKGGNTYVKLKHSFMLRYIDNYSF